MRNRKPVARRIGVIIGVAALIGMIAAQPAAAVVTWTELITNGGFETGTFAGWTVTNSGTEGGFYIDNDGVTPISSHPSVGPATGDYYAVSDQVGVGTRALEQTFYVPCPAYSVQLSFDMFVNDWNDGPHIDPAGLDWTARPNQHARVDILTEGAGVFDTGPSVLGNYYLGIDGTGSAQPYISYSFDITSVVGAGGTFKLRFAEVDTDWFFNQGVDNVSILFNPVPEPGTLALLGLGVIGLGARLRSRKR